jgi:hypothetical protein
MKATYDNNKDKLKSKSKKIIKEQFYPNTFPKDMISSKINEHGSIIKKEKRLQDSKARENKIRKSIIRGRLIGIFPFCSAHYYDSKK